MLLKDRYLIEKELGRGGIGVVYLAHDQKLHSRPVVIKVLLETVEASEHRDWFRKHFFQEVEALSRINHPGIVGVLDADEMPDGKPYIVMQFVEGRDLRTAMSDGDIDFQQVAHIIRQIGQALSAAHDKGIWHRDLKPENIMLQKLGADKEMVKLIDFGIASVRNSEVATHLDSTKIVGTVAYMAPEQLEGRPSASSDIYAAGIIAYEMLTGHLPFNPATPYRLLELQRAGVRVNPITLRPDLPVEAQNVILKALSFAEADRYQAAGDFGEQLAEALTEPSHRDSKTVPLPPPANLTQQLFNLSARSAQSLGLQLWVEAVEEERPARLVRDFVPDQQPLSPQFRLGDKAAICVRAMQDCYLWILVVGTTGSHAIIYPRTLTANNKTTAGETVRIVGTLTGSPGTETVHAFALRTPLSLTSLSVTDLLIAEESALRHSPRTDCAAATIQFVITE